MNRQTILEEIKTRAEIEALVTGADNSFVGEFLLIIPMKGDARNRVRTTIEEANRVAIQSVWMDNSGCLHANGDSWEEEIED